MEAMYYGSDRASSGSGSPMREVQETSWGETSGAYFDATRSEREENRSRSRISIEEASHEPESSGRGSKRKKAKVRLQSVEGRGKYNQGEETDPAFVRNVNDTREQKYQNSGGIPERERLTVRKVEHAREGNHPTGFVNMAGNAKKVKRERTAEEDLELASLMSLEGEDVYYQSNDEENEDFANRVNDTRKEKYKNSGGIPEGRKLTKGKVSDARKKGYHPTGFMNIADNATTGKRAKEKLVSLMSDGDDDNNGNTYHERSVEGAADFAKRVNRIRRRKYGKIPKGQELTKSKVNNARERNLNPTGFTNIDKDAKKKNNRRSGIENDNDDE